jgi:drug/metabolite transporter (DMT)-like permease
MRPRARATLLAIVSAALFGAATPLSKLLLEDLGPNVLAGLLYLGAAAWVAPSVVARARTGMPVLPTSPLNRLRLFGAVVLGGGLGPVLVLIALNQSPAASVAMWLNLETVATAVLGVVLFREHLGRLAVVGNLAVFAAGVLLVFEGTTIDLVPGLLVVMAASCWGFDNHLTALIDDIRPQDSTLFKGLVAGSLNLAIGAVLGQGLSADGGVLGAALLLGALSYGASIVAYIAAAQGLGAVRAQMIFAAAPFVGVAGAVLLGESLGPWQVVAGLLLIGANAALAFERHAHEHEHTAMRHEHAHRHDDGHHDHEHPDMPASTWHVHVHEHGAVTHTHPHLPDVHHRHRHS